jgi:hypothetical protein
VVRKMDWSYLTNQQREELKKAFDVISKVKKQINPQYREFSLINTSIYALEDAIVIFDVKRNS